MYVFQTHIKPAAGECLPSRSPAGPGSLPCRSAWLPVGRRSHQLQGAAGHQPVQRSLKGKLSIKIRSEYKKT